MQAIQQKGENKSWKKKLKKWQTRLSKVDWCIVFALYNVQTYTKCLLWRISKMNEWQKKFVLHNSILNKLAEILLARTRLKSKQIKINSKRCELVFVESYTFNPRYGMRIGKWLFFFSRSRCFNASHFSLIRILSFVGLFIRSFVRWLIHSFDDPLLSVFWKIVRVCRLLFAQCYIVLCSTVLYSTRLYHNALAATFNDDK